MTERRKPWKRPATSDRQITTIPASHEQLLDIVDHLVDEARLADVPRNGASHAAVERQPRIVLLLLGTTEREGDRHRRPVEVAQVEDPALGAVLVQKAERWQRGGGLDGDGDRGLERGHGVVD